MPSRGRGSPGLRRARRRAHDAARPLKVEGALFHAHDGALHAERSGDEVAHLHAKGLEGLAKGVQRNHQTVIDSRSTLLESHAALLAPVALARWAAEWLAEPIFCQRRMSGWRQTHVLKTQALLRLLARGLHVLLLDADRRLVGDPLPALEAIGVDVAGMRDEALINVGLLYVRASAPSLALARRVANRSLAGWDRA